MGLELSLDFLELSLDFSEPSSDFMIFLSRL